MARSARRSRSPPRQSGSTFTPLRRRDEEQLLPLLAPQQLTPKRNEEDETAGQSATVRLKLVLLTSSPLRRSGMRKPRIRGSSGFSRMNSVEGALLIDYLHVTDDAETTSANIQITPASFSVEEQPSEDKEDNDTTPSSSPKHLCCSAPQEGRLEQFLEQRRPPSERQPKNGTTKLVSKFSLNSMDTLRARANKLLPEDASNPPPDSPSETNKTPVPFAVLAKEKGATTDIFLQLRFTGDSAIVHRCVGLPKATIYNGGIVVMEDTILVSKLNKVPSASPPNGPIVPCAVRVGVTNSAA